VLERPAPTLCADRVDYGLRDSVAFGNDGKRSLCRINSIPIGTLSIEEAHSIAEDLTTTILVTDGKPLMTFRHESKALLFSKAYMACDALVWANPKHLMMYELAGEIIRMANELDLLKQDLWVSDEALWKMITSNPNCSSLKRLVEQIQDPRLLVLQSSDSDARPIRLKSRTIDPHVLVGTTNQISRLSEIMESYRKTLDLYKQYKQQPVAALVI